MLGKVQFRLQDAANPSPEELLQELFGDLVLEGELVALSDNGQEKFFAVRVPGVEQLVLLPARKGRRCPPGPVPRAAAPEGADEALIVFP